MGLDELAGCIEQLKARMQSHRTDLNDITRVVSPRVGERSGGGVQHRRQPKVSRTGFIIT